MANDKPRRQTRSAPTKRGSAGKAKRTTPATRGARASVADTLPKAVLDARQARIREKRRRGGPVDERLTRGAVAPPPPQTLPDVPPTESDDPPID